MAIRLTGAVAHLEGDWTISGVADNLESILYSLDKVQSEGSSSISINCWEIEETDTCGLQLLKVWVECARLRGIEARLINVSDGMLRAINQFGFNSLFADVDPEISC